MPFLKMFWLLSYISIASFSAALITPALPEIQHEYCLLQGEVEWIVSAFLVGYVLGQLIYAPLANCFGRLVALRTGLIINLAGILVCFMGLYFQSYLIIIIGRLITALGAASGLACTFMLINEWLPAEQRRAAMAYSIVSFTVGIGLAVLLGGIITEFSHWHNCFFLLLGHGVLMLYGTRVFRETLTRPEAINFVSILNRYKIAFFSESLFIYSLIVGLCSAIGYCFSAAGPQISLELFHLSPAEYGYWNILNMVGMIIGGLFAKFLLQKLSANQVVFLGLTGTALSLFSLNLMTNSNHLVLWFFMSTSFLYLFSGLLFAGGSYIASNASVDKASGAAMMSFINMVTATIAVVLMGYIGKTLLCSFIFIMGGLEFLLVVILGLKYVISLKLLHPF